MGLRRHSCNERGQPRSLCRDDSQALNAHAQSARAREPLL